MIHDTGVYMYFWAGRDPEVDEEADAAALREDELPVDTRKTAFNPKKFREIVKKGDCVLGECLHFKCIVFFLHIDRYGLTKR